MSVNNKIEEIKTDIANAYDAVANKGGSIPSVSGSANLAEAIASIPAGGSGGIINWDDINGRPTFNNVSRQDVQKVVLKAENWDEDNKQTAAALTVVEDETKQQIIAVPSNDSFDSYYDSNIMIIGQGKGEVFFKADTKPTEDVNVLLFIEETVNVSESYNGKWIWWSPKMTSNNTPEPYKVEQLNTSNSRTYYLFDGDLSTSNYVYCKEGSYLVLDLGSPIFISGFRFYTYSSYVPSSFELQGSNDGEMWNAVYIADEIKYDQVQSSRWYEYFSKIVNYRYYRFQFKLWSNGSTSATNLCEIEFYKWEDAE